MVLVATDAVVLSIALLFHLFQMFRRGRGVGVGVDAQVFLVLMTTVVVVANHCIDSPSCYGNPVVSRKPSTAGARYCAD